MTEYTYDYYSYHFKNGPLSTLSFEEHKTVRIYAQNFPLYLDASASGSVCFYDSDGTLIAQAEPADRSFLGVGIQITDDSLLVFFGGRYTVDYYPHCDGEYDRWGSKWFTEQIVTLDLATHAVTVSVVEDED